MPYTNTEVNSETSASLLLLYIVLFCTYKELNDTSFNCGIPTLEFSVTPSAYAVNHMWQDMGPKCITYQV